MAVVDILLSFLMLMMIYTILAFGLNIKLGHAGLLDLGHVAFFLVGAYTAALFVMPPNDPTDFTDYVIGLGDVPIVGTWAVGIIAAMLLAGVLGGLVALPTIRLREDYLAITLLGVSVLFQRIIQSETWLANGPDALRGYSRPLQSAFPLDVTSVTGALIVGFVVFVVWVVFTSVLGRRRERQLSGPASVLYSVGTFGIATRMADAPGTRSEVTALGGVIAGGLAAIVSYTTAEILLIGVAVSLFGWLVVGTELADQFGSVQPRTLLAGVVLGTGAIAALVPLVLAESTGLKIVGTLGLLGAVTYSYARAVTRVGWASEAKLAIVSVGAAWCFFLWYFIGPIRGAILAGDPADAVGTLLENLVWFLEFGGTDGIGYQVAVLGRITVGIGYSRFLLATLVVFTLAAYFVLELAVRSPFGRTLRAIRNDEDVVKSLGKDPFVYKVQSMVIGSALAGLAGALWAIYSQGLTFATGNPETTFIALLIVFLGGLGNNKAMLLGAAIYWAFQQATTQIADFFPTAMRTNLLAFRFVVIGVLFLVVLYYLPEGLLSRDAGDTGVNQR